MERLGIMALLSISLMSSICGAPHNKVTKIYHHANDNAKSANVEIGSLVFYFDHTPTIKQIAQNKKGTLIFELPDVATDSQEIAAMIAAVNASKAPHYSVRINRLKDPIAGLRVQLTFDPERVGISFEEFPTIRMERGLIVHLHNKELLNQIKAISQKPVLSIARAPKVVIDCGHGGTDTGAIGCGSLQEKEITLPIGLEVAQILADKGIDAVLTRDADVTLGLAERTALANSCGANAFISIHANSAPSQAVHGIETFCIGANDFVFKFATLHAQEKKIADSFFLSRCDQARQLADSLHRNLLAQLSKQKFSVADRKVKQGASQVLLGAHMPAVLCEIGFVTNRAESRLLQQPNYQHAIAHGISNGILQYFNAQSA